MDISVCNSLLNYTVLGLLTTIVSFKNYLQKLQQLRVKKSAVNWRMQVGHFLIVFMLNLAIQADCFYTVSRKIVFLA